jgi:hypothetical protein
MGADRQGKAKTQTGIRQVTSHRGAVQRDGHRHEMGTKARPGEGGEGKRGGVFHPYQLQGSGGKRAVGYL